MERETCRYLKARSKDSILAMHERILELEDGIPASKWNKQIKRAKEIVKKAELFIRQATMLRDLEEEEKESSAKMGM